MIPVGSEVTLRNCPFRGVCIGHFDSWPVIRIDKLVISERDIISYTDEDGNVRIMEEPIT